MTGGKLLTIRLKRRWRQNGGMDCGLFAIAMAASLCKNKDPTKLVYDQKMMRTHLLECLEAQDISELTHCVLLEQKPETYKVVTENVYCLCRFPDNNERMVECIIPKEWLHQTCQSIKTKLFQNEKIYEQVEVPSMKAQHTCYISGNELVQLAYNIGQFASTG